MGENIPRWNRQACIVSNEAGGFGCAEDTATCGAGAEVGKERGNGERDVCGRGQRAGTAHEQATDDADVS